MCVCSNFKLFFGLVFGIVSWMVRFFFYGIIGCVCFYMWGRIMGRGYIYLIVFIYDSGKVVWILGRGVVVWWFVFDLYYGIWIILNINSSGIKYYFKLYVEILWVRDIYIVYLYIFFCWFLWYCVLKYVSYFGFFMCGLWWNGFGVVVISYKWCIKCVWGVLRINVER